MDPQVRDITPDNESFNAEYLITSLRTDITGFSISSNYRTAYTERKTRKLCPGIC